jgi:polar amino acid transport system substrate-binding protein
MLTVATSACVQTEERSTWDRIRATGIVRVGYAVEPPFVLVDSTGRVSGESPEVFRLVMADIGIDSIEWVATEFGSLIRELQRGEFDVIAAGMYVTPERESLVLFTRPTMIDTAALLVRSDNVTPLTDLAQFIGMPKRRLAIITGAAEERLALAAGVAPSQLLAVPDPGTGRAAVHSGEADAFMLSEVSLARLRRSRSDSADFAVIAVRVPEAKALSDMALGRPAYAVRRDDAALREAIDQGLARVLGTTAHSAVRERFGLTVEDTSAPRRTPAPPGAR